MVAQKFVAEFPVAKLIEHPENPRRGNVGLIGESIAVNGFYGTVVVQESTNRIIVGNHRARAAVNAGMETLPVMVLDIDDEQATRIMLADNRTNDVAFYDDASLAALLESLEGDLAGTGFNNEDLELLLARVESIQPEEPPPADGPWLAPKERVQAGDIWEVGNCRFICGDCRDPAIHELLLEERTVNLAFTSPPYADHRRYDPDSPFTPIHPDRYVEWFEAVQENVGQHLAEDGSWIVNIRTGAADGMDMETYVYDLVLTHARQWGWHWGSEYCWERIGVPKQPMRRFKPAYEMVYQFAKGRWKFRPDNVRHYSTDVPQALGSLPDGEGGRTTTWSEVANWTGELHGQPGANSFFEHHEHQADLAYPSNRLPTFVGDHVATGHPAAFPPGLARFFVLAYTDPDEVILDPFAGSGSTLLAANMTGRMGFGIEVSPKYCDIILQRLEEGLNVPADLVHRDD